MKFMLVHNPANVNVVRALPGAPVPSRTSLAAAPSRLAAAWLPPGCRLVDQVDQVARFDKKVTKVAAE